IATGLVTVGVAYFFGSKLAVQSSSSVSFKEAWKEGKGMVRMGIMLSLSTIIAGLVAYVVRIFIGRQGGLTDVGLYNAGFAIVNTYVGMIFTAISTDYYPRLAAVAHDRVEANRLVNQQTEMALLILGPILITFLIALKFVMLILYTAEFLSIMTMVQWFVVAIIFKAIAWALGFLFLAKGDSKVFFWNELVANVYLLLLSILGYYYFGLEGLGISFLISFVLSVIQNFLIVHYRHQFAMEGKLIIIFFVNLLLITACAFIMRFIPQPLSYFYAAPFLMASIGFSWWQMNKRIDFQHYLNRIFPK
ncbi:MAG: oligosaccharide flippase family protein, partial [Chitinophagaceae bacterium]